MKGARGKPETSIVADIEPILAKYHVSRAAYHGGDFNGVCCWRIVGLAKPICDEIQSILVSKRDRSCEEIIIYNKVDNFENTLGLLDAAFAYLNILHPTDEEKEMAQQAVKMLMKYWREDAGLSVSLKGHVMEKHVCDFNNTWGVGDKEESFIEQGHQVGLKDDRRYRGLTNFEEKIASTLKAWAITSHPSVKETQTTVVKSSARNCLAPKTDREDGQMKRNSGVKR
jgi:hypothetical protein